MANITLTAPSGIKGPVIGSDGAAYAIAAGVVTLPANVAGPLFAAGFYYASGSGGTGATGGTGSTGTTGGTAATGVTGTTGGTGLTGGTGGTGAAASAMTVRIAAGVPSGAPTGTEGPVALDTTAVSGGLYVWSGAAWIKGSVIP